MFEILEKGDFETRSKGERRTVAKTHKKKLENDKSWYIVKAVLAFLDKEIDKVRRSVSAPFPSFT